MAQIKKQKTNTNPHLVKSQFPIKPKWELSAPQLASYSF